MMATRISPREGAKRLAGPTGALTNEASVGDCELTTEESGEKTGEAESADVVCGLVPVVACTLA